MEESLPCLNENGTFNIPGDILFPDEINRYLKDQILYLNHENVMIKKQIALNKSESELHKLNSKTDTSEQIPLGQIATKKFVELSKKLREKCAELEAYKTKFSKLEMQLTVLNSDQIRNATNNIDVKKDINILHTTSKIGISEEEYKTQQDRIRNLNAKLCEMRNTNLQLRTDLKHAQKIVLDEVGENAETLLDRNSDLNATWRGRAQTIANLQRKNEELKEKLKTYEKKGVSKQADSIVQIKQMYEKKLEMISKENFTLKNELNDMRKKLDSSRARLKVSEAECTHLKSKINNENDKTDRNKDVITTLTAQLTNFQKMHNELLLKKENAQDKLEDTVRYLRLELKSEKCKAENAEKIIAEKQRELETLTDFSNPISRKNDKTIEYFDVERRRLLELTSTLSQQLQNERDDNSKLQQQFKQERQRLVRLETKLVRFQLAQNALTDNNSYSYQSKSNHRLPNNENLLDKLELAEEHIKALETRLNIERKEREFDLQKFSEILNHKTTVVEQSLPIDK